MQRIVFPAAGGDLPNPFESQEETLTVEDVRRRALGDRYNDIIDIPEEESMFGYRVENN